MSSSSNGFRYPACHELVARTCISPILPRRQVPDARHQTYMHDGCNPVEHCQTEDIRRRFFRGRAPRRRRRRHGRLQRLILSIYSRQCLGQLWHLAGDLLIIWSGNLWLRGQSRHSVDLTRAFVCSGSRCHVFHWWSWISQGLNITRIGVDTSRRPSAIYNAVHFCVSISIVLAGVTENFDPDPSRSCAESTRNNTWWNE